MTISDEELEDALDILPSGYDYAGSIPVMVWLCGNEAWKLFSPNFTPRGMILIGNTQREVWRIEE